MNKTFKQLLLIISIILLVVFSAFSDDGDAIFVDSNGNVGIGNASPSYKLDVAGSINLTGNLYSDGTASIGFSSGNVGVGILTPAYKLEVDGAVILQNTSTPSYASGHAGIFTNNGELYSIDQSGNTTQISPHDPETGDWRFYSRNIKTGRVVLINMEEVVKEVEKLSGKTLIKEWVE